MFLNVLEKIKKILLFLSKSVLINACLLSMLVTGFLYVFFQLLPKNGTISLEIIPKTIEDSFFNNDAIQIKDTLVNSVFSGEIEVSTGLLPIIIQPDSQLFFVDGSAFHQEYGYSYSIISEPNMNGDNIEEWIYTIKIKSDGDIFIDFPLADVGITPDNSMVLTIADNRPLTCKSTKKMKVSIIGHNMLLKKQNNYNTEDYNYSHIMVLEFPEDGQFQIRPESSDFNISAINTSHSLYQYSLNYENMKSLTIYYAYELLTRGFGNLHFYNTANSKTFALENQIISCHSDGKLNGSFIDNKLSVIGDVDNVSIMGYNIIPSFGDWMKDSVLVIPSMLITIFGGAISIAISNRSNRSSSDCSKNGKHPKE